MLSQTFVKAIHNPYVVRLMPSYHPDLQSIHCFYFKVHQNEAETFLFQLTSFNISSAQVILHGWIPFTLKSAGSLTFAMALNI